MNTVHNIYFDYDDSAGTGRIGGAYGIDRGFM